MRKLFFLLIFFYMMSTIWGTSNHKKIKQKKVIFKRFHGMLMKFNPRKGVKCPWQLWKLPKPKGCYNRAGDAACRMYTKTPGVCWSKDWGKFVRKSCCKDCKCNVKCGKKAYAKDHQ